MFSGRPSVLMRFARVRCVQTLFDCDVVWLKTRMCIFLGIHQRVRIQKRHVLREAALMNLRFGGEINVHFGRHFIACHVNHVIPTAPSTITNTHRNTH